MHAEGIPVEEHENGPCGAVLIAMQHFGSGLGFEMHSCCGAVNEAAAHL